MKPRKMKFVPNSSLPVPNFPLSLRQIRYQILKISRVRYSKTTTRTSYGGRSAAVSARNIGRILFIITVVHAREDGRRVARHRGARNSDVVVGAKRGEKSFRPNIGTPSVCKQYDESPPLVRRVYIYMCVCVCVSAQFDIRACYCYLRS